jgi:predicted HicB family RNase H-like nuclease
VRVRGVTYELLSNIRIPTDLHRRASKKATMMGISLNQFVQRALEEKVAV